MLQTIYNLIGKHRNAINRKKTGEEQFQFVSAEYNNVLPNVIKNEFKKLNVSLRTI